MAAPQTYMLVAVGPTGKRHDPGEAMLDLDQRDELREHLIRLARSVDSYRSGSASGGEWLNEWELEIYTPREASKGTYAGGWAKPEKVVTFPR